MTIKLSNHNKISFESIAAGEVFEFNKRFFLKIHDLNYGVGLTIANAIDLQNMIGAEFYINELVHPLNAELILTEKENK